jgi:hypothetical protein
MSRPRTFVWVSRNGVPFPQIWFDDPRVGCAAEAPMPGTDRKLDPSDNRSLEQLAADHPAPISAEAS